MRNDTPLTAWAPGQAAGLGRQLALADHRLAQLPLFADAALADLLDRHPRARLQAYTMAVDPSGLGERMPVDVGDASGAELLSVVERGRLWLNVLRVDESDDGLGHLQRGLFDEIGAQNSDLDAASPRSTLLISSPGAHVDFHVDAGPNALWHIRGTKRIFVYPALDERFVERPLLEDIYVAEHEEYVPYSPEFDEDARAFDLRPGQVIAWPQNSPHRVENLAGVNVSLSCEFATGASRRRELLWCGNRYLSRNLQLPVRSTRETGPMAAAKRLVFRAARKAHLARPRPGHVYLATVRVDPEAPEGLRPIRTPSRAPFSTG